MAIVHLWCSAARSAFSAPEFLVFLVSVGLRTQYRPPTVSPRRGEANSAVSILTPVSVCRPRRPALSAGSCFARSTKSPLVPSGRKNPRSRHGGTEHSRKPFLESPADFVTRAPNLTKLGQADRARQDLV